MFHQHSAHLLVDVAKEGDIITPELKNDGDVLVRFDIKKNQYDLPDFEQVKALYSAIHEAYPEEGNRICICS